MKAELIEKIESAYAAIWEAEIDLDILQNCPFYELWLKKDMDPVWLAKRDEFYLEALLEELEDVLESAAELSW